MGVPGKVICQARGTDSGVYFKTFSGGNFVAANWSSTYTNLGGITQSDTSCAPTNINIGSSGVLCGTIGAPDSALYYDVNNSVFGGGSWTGWTKVGGAAIGSPSCFAIQSGAAMCVIVGVNGLAESMFY